MTTSATGFSAPVGPKWLMAMLAVALIIGIVLMHSLMSATDAGSHTDTMTGASMVHTASTSDMAMPGSAGQEDPAGTGGGMSDCSGLMAMCLALLISLMVFVGRSRFMSRWVLWQRPPPSFIRMGVVREAFLEMTARQRTTVIRC